MVSVSENYAQKIKYDKKNIEDIIEDLIGFDNNTEDYNKLIDHFSSLIDKPIQINKATRKDLEKLYILNVYQINNILIYKNKYGNIYSIYELITIDGLNKNILQKIAPFLSFETEIENKKRNKKSKQILISRVQSFLETEKGYKQETTNKYQGDKIKLYNKYSYLSASKKLKLGFTTEKDPGESFFKGNNKHAFDYYSAHIEYSNINKTIKKINIGDYKLSLGQGLVMWSAMSMGKSSNTCLHAKRLQGQKAYTSTDENNFLRGISVHTKPLRNVDIINFVSYNKKDSRTQLIDSIIYSSAVSEGGLHRTKSEIDKKDNLKETIWGSNILYSHKNIKLGATYINYHYSPYITNDDNLYNTFSFSGNKNYNYSIYYQTRYKKINFYGEIASCKSSGKALIQGINIDASSQVQVEII